MSDFSTVRNANSQGVALNLEFASDCRVRLKFRRNGTGDWGPHGMFIEYPDRQGDPHLTFMAAPNPKRDNKFTPHFTNTRLPVADRRFYLAELRVEELEYGVAKLMDLAADDWRSRSSETTLGELARTGWLVVGGRKQALSRWVRRGGRLKPGEYSMGPDNVLALALHALGHSCSPRSLIHAREADLWLAWRGEADCLVFGTILISPEQLAENLSAGLAASDWRCSFVPDAEGGLDAELKQLLLLDDLRAKAAEVHRRIEAIPVVAGRLPDSDIDVPEVAYRICGHFLPFLLGASLEAAQIAPGDGLSAEA